ncbi:hypothetical protein C479_04192 [Halovivax asiaticus JCM 14624]|uniref:Uncharacterized protein n=1 Tax=Halovivax asiaticus JCM 14624 TaxID=1227490 RepID=M0BNZ0_9EURY|nr:hypothetical protein [Halovivax asiaticus]ELZ12565.1 hypothetical protein C479_04192 [Halovivax asiaticus JCM 14624]
MVGINELPDFVYIDEARVKQKLQFVNEGQVAELVETHTENESKTSGGGLNLYKILKYNRQKSSGETEEVVRTIQSTPVGQLAVFFGMMDDEMGVEELESLSKKKRAQLDDNDYISVTGRIRESPVAKLMRISDKYNFDISDYVDFSEEEIDPVAFKNELDDARDYYEIEMSGEVDGRYVFKLSQNDLTDVADEFPSKYREYTVFGRIEHIFEGSEREHHFSIFDEMNTRDRSERQERRRKMKKMADEMSGLYDEETNESMFYIESPDIRLTPIAIFS